MVWKNLYSVKNEGGVYKICIEWYLNINPVSIKKRQLISSDMLIIKEEKSRKQR